MRVYLTKYVSMLSKKLRLKLMKSLIRHWINFFQWLVDVFIKIIRTPKKWTKLFYLPWDMQNEPVNLDVHRM